MKRFGNWFGYGKKERRLRTDEITLETDPNVIFQDMSRVELIEFAETAMENQPTGLLTRHMFELAVKTRLSRRIFPLSLYVVDIVGLHDINEIHGRFKGSEVIRAAAESMRDSMRRSFYAVRIGGDELGALVYPDVVAEIPGRMTQALKRYELPVGFEIPFRYGFVDVKKPEHISYALDVAVEKAYKTLSATPRVRSS